MNLERHHNEMLWNFDMNCLSQNNKVKVCDDELVRSVLIERVMWGGYNFIQSVSAAADL